VCNLSSCHKAKSCKKKPLKKDQDVIEEAGLSTEHFITHSGITKIYYRKTVGHVFMKPVQIEETGKIFSQ